MTSADHLFVYGTLRRAFDGPQSRQLAARARLIGAARIPGRLYDLGNYPGARLSSEPDEYVIGDLYELPGAAMLIELDRYERCGPTDPHPQEFRRVAVTAIPENGAATRAWVYEYNQEPPEHHRIASGDYLAYRREAKTREG